MAKLTGPMLSFGAKGQIGKTLVASNWRGVKYARQYVVPNNPQTTAQQDIRAIFAYLREMWKRAPTELVSTWDSFALGRPFTGMNKWVGENVRVLKNQSDLDNIIFSPGSGGGLIQVSDSAMTGSSAGEIDWTATPPTPPTDWSLTAAIAVAVADGDPTGIFDGVIIAERDTTSTYGGTLAGLPTNAACQCGIWLEWEKPNGKTAYSASTTTQVTSGS